MGEPKLQPPGAGLPLLQKIVLRVWMGPVTSKHTPREKCREKYELLTRKIIDKVSIIPEKQRNIKILVSPIRGLEDSSRYWSLNGVLEHLMIVSKNIEAVISNLSAGTVPNGQADTARVKPTHFDTSLLEEFKGFAPTLYQQIDDRLKVSTLGYNSPTKFVHPWFGPLTTRQWYWLLSSHQGIHYNQIKQIIAGLNLGNSRRGS